MASTLLVLSISPHQVATSHHRLGTSHRSRDTSLTNHSTSLVRVNSRTSSLVLHSRISQITPQINQIRVHCIQVLHQHRIQVSLRKIRSILKILDQTRRSQTSRTLMNMPRVQDPRFKRQ